MSIIEDEEDERQRSKTKTAARYFIFAFNLLTFIGGFGLLFVGVALKTHYKLFFDFIDEALFDLSLSCIVLAVLVCLVSFLGLYGSIKEDYCGLVAFGTCLGFIIAVELAVGVSAFALAQQNRLVDVFGDQLQASLEEYGSSSNNSSTLMWDTLQGDLECCGVVMPGDWAMSPWSRAQSRSGDRLPASCCYTAKDRPDSICSMSSSSSKVHMKGCLGALEAGARNNAGILGAAACIIAAGQILLVIATVKLVRRVKKPESCGPCF